MRVPPRGGQRQLVGATEQRTEAFTVAGLDSDATADATFTDGFSNTVDVTGNGRQRRSDRL